ncbi:MAG: hypothetical protein IKX42_08365 [Fibrobacter sp.]|nr:hypothetical protein [Fibrobacter sp.]
MKKIYLLVTLMASMSFATRIGVLMNSSSCETGETVVIDMDVEDSNNDTKVVDGKKENLPNPGVSLGGHVIFKYCVLNVSSATQVKFDYAVLRLDKKCPSGAQPFQRHHDNEDSNNANHSSGKISPNVVNKDATLEYCFVPKDSKSKVDYPVGKNYGVFAKPKSGEAKDNVVYTKFKVDDNDDDKRKVCHTETKCKEEMKEICFNFGGKMECEMHGPYTVCTDKNVCDDLNNNTWNYYSASQDIIDRIKRFAHDEENTMYGVVKWVKNLKKSAAFEEANAPMVTVLPAAPSIKGLDRSAVAVDLKSAGALKVSIVDINGAVIAHVAQENLQAGSHYVKWNSGLVPSGRYVVKVEQNGMVDAKSVILK